MKGDLHSFIRKEVEIVAHGVIYRGILIEVSEVEVHLKTESRWINLPTADVMEIREPGKHDRGLYKMIDKDFFNLDE
jgi:hypothetical protein